MAQFSFIGKAPTSGYAFNAAQFGVLPDGTYQDDNMKAALAAVSAHGGVLYVNAGTFKFARGLQGPASGMSSPNTGLRPAVASDPSDFRFYELEVQTIGGAGGTCRYKSHPLKTWDASNVPFVFGQALVLAPNPASIVLPQAVLAGDLFRWRGGGVGSLPSSPIQIVGSGRATVFEFDFSGSGGVGDGIVQYWDTVSNGGAGLRISQLVLKNTSPTNKCTLSAVTDGGGAPAGFSAAGSPTNPLDRYRVEIVGGGGLGVATWRVARDNGATIPSYSLPSLVPASGTIEIPGSAVTLTFPAAVFAPGNFWEFEAVGYGGSALMNVGGTGVVNTDIVTLGWKTGETIDGGTSNDNVYVLVLPGVLLPVDGTVGMFIANANLYFNRTVSFATNILVFSGCLLAGRFGVLDFGGVLHEFVQINFAASTGGYFGSARALLVSQAYFEATPIAHFETDYLGSIDSFAIEDTFVSNTLATPLLINRLQLLNLKLSDVVVAGAPNGTAPIPEYGILAAQNNAHIQSGGSLLQTLTVESSSLPVAPSTPGAALVTTEPQGSTYTGASPGTFGRHGFNVVAPAASLHLRRTDTTVPLFTADYLGAGVTPKFEVDSDAQGTVISTGDGATGGQPRGRITRVRRATTLVGAPGAPVTAFDYPLGTRQAVRVVVTAGAFDTNGARVGIWRQQAAFYNFVGGANAVQIGITALESADLTAGLALAVPLLQVNAAVTGFEVVLGNGTEANPFRWTLTVEIDETGDGG